LFYRGCLTEEAKEDIQRRILLKGGYRMREFAGVVVREKDSLCNALIEGRWVSYHSEPGV
jgi:hypothetical protein